MHCRLYTLCATLALLSFHCYSQTDSRPIEVRAKNFMIIARGNFDNHFQIDTAEGKRKLHFELIYDSAYFYNPLFKDSVQFARQLINYQNFIGYLVLAGNAMDYSGFSIEFDQHIPGDSIRPIYKASGKSNEALSSVKLSYGQRMFLLRQILPLYLEDSLYKDSLVVTLTPRRDRPSIIKEPHSHELIHNYLEAVGIELSDCILQEEAREIHVYYQEGFEDSKTHFIILRPGTKEYDVMQERFLILTAKPS